MALARSASLILTLMLEKIHAAGLIRAAFQLSLRRARNSSTM